MKIIELRAENLKKIKVVSIKPGDESLVQITGKNGAGKTSVLDAIFWAMAGTKNVQAQPIRQGEDEASVTLDLGDYKVVRKFIRKDDGDFTTSIKVETPDGARYGTPQELMNKWLGQFTFDPLAFMRLPPEQQVRSLKSLVTDYDFAAGEQASREDFAARTDVNRTVKERKAERAGIVLPETLPEAVDIAATVEEMRQAEITNRTAQEKRDQWADGRAQIATLDQEIEKTRNEIIRLENYITNIERDREGRVARFSAEEPTVETIDIEPFRTKIAGAQEVNAQHTYARRATALDSEIKTLEGRAEALTKAMDARKKLATDAIAAAPIPVKGLTIEADIVHLDGVPFEQASDAQQLRTSIGLAMAMNPDLKVIRVRDGSLLDEDAMKALAEMATESDYQIWIERVDGSGEVGFVMEDGRLKGQDIQPEEKPAKKAKPQKEDATDDAGSDAPARPKDGMSAVERVKAARRAREAEAAQGQASLLDD